MERKHVQTSLVNLSYVEQGTGKALLLLHGASSFSEIFVKNIAPLSENFKVVSLDLIGFGYSPLTDIATLEDYLKTIDEFIDAVSDKEIYILGHSMGSHLALLYTFFYPQRVKKLVMSSFVSLPKPLTMIGRTGPGSRLAAKFTDAPATDNIEKFRKSARDIFYDVEKLDSRSLEMLKKGSEMSKGMAMSIRLISCSKLSFPVMLKEIKCPVLFLAGVKDPLIRINKLKKLVEENDFEFALFDKSKHMPMLEQPEVYNKTITKFLNGT